MSPQQPRQAGGEPALLELQLTRPGLEWDRRSTPNRELAAAPAIAIVLSVHRLYGTGRLQCGGEAAAVLQAHPSLPGGPCIRKHPLG